MRRLYWLCYIDNICNKIYDHYVIKLVMYSPVYCWSRPNSPHYLCSLWLHCDSDYWIAANIYHELCTRQMVIRIFLVDLEKLPLPFTYIKHKHCHKLLVRKSLMAEWLEQASQWHEMYSHNLEVMSSNPGRIELGVRSTSVLNHILTKNINQQIFV